MGKKIDKRLPTKRNITRGIPIGKRVNIIRSVNKMIEGQAAVVCRLSETSDFIWVTLVNHPLARDPHNEVYATLEYGPFHPKQLSIIS